MDESTEESQSSPDDVAPQSPGTYQSRTHKLATLFMMTAGGTNAAMFPMMFIFYGGMPFLVAYLTLLATVAMPMMQLESNLAQFAGDGNCGIFTTVPLFFGTGYALTLYVLLRVVADTVPLSDVLVQMAGMTDTFAWGRDRRRQHSWVEQSFENIRAQPLLCIAALWLLVFAIAHRGFVGIKSFFYVVLSLHVTTTLMLLARGVMLDGSIRGLNMFFHADWSHILNIEARTSACTRLHRDMTLRRLYTVC
ncbi:hypothetical protein V5799_004545 [Amblyomma americanum]|uniref:Uncharacterized protein n=1 Tax=Amblyomma americanum TaxID=6943 RepID=A0AAQ4D5T6_AMBAM